MTILSFEQRYLSTPSLVYMFGVSERVGSRKIHDQLRKTREKVLAPRSSNLGTTARTRTFPRSYKRLEVTADRTWSGNEAGLVKTITQRSSSLKRMSRCCAYGMTAVGDCRAFQRTACALWERARGTCSDSVISALKDREPSKAQFNEGPYMQKLLQHLSPPCINLALRLLPSHKLTVTLHLF